MKYLSEYRNSDLALQILEEIRSVYDQTMENNGGLWRPDPFAGQKWNPECITRRNYDGSWSRIALYVWTPLHLIDKAIYLAEQKNVILCSFGDMIRVPGSKKSLLEAKAEGADIRILYSPIEAVTIAKENPEKEVVFFAVGFENNSSCQRTLCATCR